MNFDLNRPLLVGICGGSASGKTSVANVINKFIGYENCLLFSMDNYYKGPTPEERKRIEEYNFDMPAALDLDLLFTQLRTLLENKPIDMPIYEFNGSFRRKETNRVVPKKIIIFEGILAFHDKRIRDLMDIKIFVNLDPDLRLARRIERDIADRGRELHSIIERYHKFVKPAFETYIKPTKKYADLVIPRGAENSMATDLVSQFLRVYLAKTFGKHNNEFNQLQKKEFSSNDILIKDTADNDFVKPNFSEKEAKTLVQILENYMNAQKICYDKLYLEYLNGKLLEIILKNYDKKNIIIFKKTNYNEDKITEGKNAILFIPILITSDMLNFMENIKKPITIASIFLSEECHKKICETNKNIKFITIYYGDFLKQYEEYIRKGGYLTYLTSDELPEEYYPLNSKNFETEFEKSVKANNLHKS